MSPIHRTPSTIGLMAVSLAFLRTGSSTTNRLKCFPRRDKPLHVQYTIIFLLRWKIIFGHPNYKVSFCFHENLHAAEPRTMIDVPYCSGDIFGGATQNFWIRAHQTASAWKTQLLVRLRKSYCFFFMVVLFSFQLT